MGGHKHVSGAKRPVTQLLFQVLSDDDRQTDAIGSLRANTPSSREAAAAACKALRRCLGATAAADVCAGASILLAGRCREFMPWAGSQAQKPPPPHGNRLSASRGGSGLRTQGRASAYPRPDLRRVLHIPQILPGCGQCLPTKFQNVRTTKPEMVTNANEILVYPWGEPIPASRR